MKRHEPRLEPIFIAIRQAQEKERQRDYEKAIEKQKAVLRERQKRDEELTRKLFFAQELLEN